MPLNKSKERRERRRVTAKEWADKQDRGFEPTAVKLPEGFSWFSIKSTGRITLDMIPHVAGKGNPNADEGFEIAHLEYYAHWVPDLTGKAKSYICSASCIGKKCAVCDYLKRNPDNKDLADSLKSKKRMLWNVIDHSDKDKKIKVWDTPYWKSFGEKLKDAIRVSDKYDNYDDPESGYSVQLTVKESTNPKFGKFEIARVDLVPRDNQYELSIMDEACVLEDCLIVPDYDELMALLKGDAPPEDKNKVEEGDQKPEPEEEEETEEEEPEEEEETEEEPEEEAVLIFPSNRKKVAPEETEEEPEEEAVEFAVGMEVKYKKKQWTVVKVSGDGTSLTLKDEDDNMAKAVDPDDVQVLEVEEELEEEAEPEQPKVRGKKPKEPEEEEEEPEEEEDDLFKEEEEEDDEPVPPKRGRKK